MAQSDTERQGDRDIEFGMKAIDKGYVAPVHLQTALRRLNERRVDGTRSSLAQILIEMDLLSTEQAKEVLRELPTTELICTNPECRSTFNVLAYDPGKKYACRNCKASLRATDEEDVVQPAGKPGDDGLSVEADPRAELGGGAPEEDAEDEEDDREIQYSFAVPDDLLPGVESVPREDIFAKNPPAQDEDVDPYAPPEESKVGPSNEGEGFVAGVPEAPAPGEPPPIPGLSTGSFEGFDPPAPSGAQDEEEPATGAGFGGGAGLGGHTGPAVEESEVGGYEIATGYDYNADGSSEGSEVSTLEQEGHPDTGLSEQPQPAGQQPKKGAGALLALLIVGMLGVAGGGGYVLYEQLLASQSPTSDEEPRPTPEEEAEEEPTPEEIYAEAREHLAAMLHETAEPTARLERLEAKLTEHDALLEARLAKGKVLANTGDWEAAREVFQHVLYAEEMPPGLDRASWQALRSEAGFWIGLSLMLDERELEQGVQKQQTFAAAADLGDNPFALASAALHLQLRHRAAGEGDGYGEAWTHSLELPGRLQPLVQGILLAWGVLPGLAPTRSEDYDEARRKLEAAMAKADAASSPEEAEPLAEPLPDDAPLAPLRAFLGLLRGAYASEPQPERAEQDLHRAQQQGADEATVELYRGIIAKRQRHTAASEAQRETLHHTAERLLERAFEDELPRAGLNLAKLAYQQREFPRAQELLERLPAGIGTRRLRAKIELELGHAGEAVRLLNEIEVPSAETLGDLALAHLLREEPRPAKRAIHDALRESPDDPRLLARRAYASYLASQQTGDEDRQLRLEDRAREELGELLELYPDHPEVNRWYGLLFIDTPRAFEGMQHLRTSLELEPRQWRLWLVLAEQLLQRFDAEGALAALEEAEPHIPTAQRSNWRELRDRAHRELE